MKLHILLLTLIASLLLSGCQGLPTGMFVKAEDSIEPVTVTKSIPLESPVVDSDNDGVKDELDICPDTPDEETVNEEGCSCSNLQSTMKMSVQQTLVSTELLQMNH